MGTIQAAGIIQEQVLITHLQWFVCCISDILGTYTFNRYYFHPEEFKPTPVFVKDTKDYIIYTSHGISVIATLCSRIFQKVKIRENKGQKLIFEFDHSDCLAF